MAEFGGQKFEEQPFEERPIAGQPVEEPSSEDHPFFGLGVATQGYDGVPIADDTPLRQLSGPGWSTEQGWPIGAGLEFATIDLRGTLFRADLLEPVLNLGSDISAQVAELLAASSFGRTVLIGRSDTGLIREPSTLSREHVLVTAYKNGIFTVTDAGSKNGTCYLTPGLEQGWKKLAERPKHLPFGTIIKCGDEQAFNVAWFQLTNIRTIRAGMGGY